MFFVQSRKKTKRLRVECQKEEDKYEFRNTNRNHLYGTEWLNITSKYHNEQLITTQNMHDKLASQKPLKKEHLKNLTKA